jgi:hypothetical protein
MAHSFLAPKHFVMACHITGVYDVNRNNTLPDDDYSLVKNWAESVAALQLNGIIFHNNFTEKTCAKYQNEYITFIKIAYSAHFNPNVYRYLVYRDFLRSHIQEIESLFITDISDAVVVNNPFIQPLFIDNADALFCGDEPKILDNEWMVAHSEHLRSKIADYAAYEETFANETLLNCGIIGGNIGVMEVFIEKLCLIHEQYNHDNETAYTGDMGAFNYLVRTQFNQKLLHGAPINTAFKGYQEDRNDCWFRHK